MTNNTFYHQVMGFKQEQEQVDAAVNLARNSGYRVEGRGLPSVREKALNLSRTFRDRTNFFVGNMGYIPDSQPKVVEETLKIRKFSLRFDKSRRDAYNRTLDLITEVAPSASSPDLRAYPIWRPANAANFVLANGLLPLIGIIGLAPSLYESYENATAYILSGVLGAVTGNLLIGAKNARIRSVVKDRIREEASRLTNIIRESPQRIGRAEGTQ